ncbi:hypothetical protein KEJ37_00095 [Candidatus Bathyarchaeota archaeon]|nr:hypothetical protein [Candidatus Bathyarchaeota archaeon]
MTEKKQVLDVQIILKGREKDRFLKIKRFVGLSDVEALRLMINEYFEKKLAGEEAQDKPCKR